MGTNYTPINKDQIAKKFQQKPTVDSASVATTADGHKFNINTILLLIGTLTAVVLAFMLFVLIQKKMQSQQTMPAIETQTPTVVTTRAPSPAVSPTTPAITLPSVVTPQPLATGSATPTATPSGLLTSPTASPSGIVR